MRSRIRARMLNVRRARINRRLRARNIRRVVMNMAEKKYITVGLNANATTGADTTDVITAT